MRVSHVPRCVRIHTQPAMTSYLSFVKIFSGQARVLCSFVKIKEATSDAHIHSFFLRTSKFWPRLNVCICAPKFVLELLIIHNSEYILEVLNFPPYHGDPRILTLGFFSKCIPDFRASMFL